jgi:cathepsin A (carboxypeptidase C)
VNAQFHSDWMHHFEEGFPAMLEAGVRVLIYAGEVRAPPCLAGKSISVGGYLSDQALAIAQMDYICNYQGNKAWTLQLPWTGQTAFQKAEDTPWMVRGKKSGLVRSAGGLTFLQVAEAGHMVPLDQPEASLAMLNQFLSGE